MFDYASMPSIITGSGGFVGRHLAAHFESRGWPVIALDRAACDLTDRKAVLDLFQALPKAGRLFHLATFQRTGIVQYQMTAELLDVNARMHLNVLEAWSKYQPQAKLVAAGSSCLYPVRNDPIPESAFQTGPLHESVRGYGLAKQMLVVAAESLARQKGLSALVCVFATLYGPGDHLAPERSHFIGGMMARALAGQAAGGKEFPVHGSPHTLRECLYVSDQIEALLAADAAFENGFYNCAANRPVTLDGMARAIRDVLGWDVPTVYPQAGYAGADRKQINSSHFLQATGWTPATPLEEGLRLLADDLRPRLPRNNLP